MSMAISNSFQTTTTIAQLIVKGVVQHFDKIDFSYNFLQALWTKNAEKNPYTFSRFHKFEKTFLIGDAISLISTGILCIANIEKEYKVITKFANVAKNYQVYSNGTLQNITYGDCALMIGTASLVTLTAASFFAVHLINKFSNKKIDAGFTDALWVRPKSEELKQVLYVARIIINCALVISSPTRLFQALSTAMQTYSLLKVSQRTWILFSALTETTIYNQSRQILATAFTLSYTFLVQKDESKLKTDSNVEKDTCSICHEEDSQPDTYFCRNHTFHATCLNGYFKTKTNEFGPKISITNLTRFANNGSAPTSTHYKCTAPQSAIPSCPNCRDRPSHNELSVTLRDPVCGWSGATMTWTKDQ